MDSDLSKLPQLKIRFGTNWNTCNYHCEYCVTDQPHAEYAQQQQQNSPLPILTRIGNAATNPGQAVSNLVRRVTGTPEESVDWDEDKFLRVVDHLEQLPYRLNVRIGVGGETFINKTVVEGARRLTTFGNVEALNLITNLSFDYDRYQKVLDGFDLSKVAFVCSYHPTEIRDKDLWLETAVRMRELVDMAIVLVGWPPLMPDMISNRQMLMDKGFEVFAQAFNGWYEERKYPEAYTAEELQILRKVIYSRYDYEHMVDLKQPGLCYAGTDYVYCDVNGDVYRCGTYRVPIGNLFNGFKLSATPQQCPGKECWCDTENLNTVEFRKLYELQGLNQHKYKYRHPDKDEWAGYQSTQKVGSTGDAASNL